MDKYFKFENLNVWQRAMELGENINELSVTFPKKELYNLTSQICRASDSIALNISEGSIGQSIAEQNKFTGYAIRSLAEVVTCLHKAKLRNYVPESIFKNLYMDCYNLMNMLIGYRKSVK